MSEDESWMGGKTVYLYGDQRTREKTGRFIIDPEMQRKFESTIARMDSYLQTSDPSDKALPGRFIYSF